jgi:hypothetical protein
MEGGGGESGNSSGTGNSGGNLRSGNDQNQQRHTEGEPYITNTMENWSQSGTDRPTEQPAAASNVTMGRPRLGSKRGRDGGGTPETELQQEDGPPRTRQRQLQL